MAAREKKIIAQTECGWNIDPGPAEAKPTTSVVGNGGKTRLQEGNHWVCLPGFCEEKIQTSGFLRNREAPDWGQRSTIPRPKGSVLLKS